MINRDRAQIAALGARPEHRRDTHCGTCDGSGWIETTAGDVACLVCHYPPTCPGCVGEVVAPPLAPGPLAGSGRAE